MKDFKLDGQELKEAKVIGISDLRIEGLEKERESWKLQCIKAEKIDDVKRATNDYSRKIEEALNQPIAMVLKKANFTDLNDSVIIDRDPGKKAMIRMRDDDAAGKTLHEKAKSSVHGISLAGYIPVDQEFGKAGDSGQTARFNDIVTKRFADQREDEDKLNSMVALKNEGKSLTKEQNQELEQILSTNPVAKMQLKDEQGREIYGVREELKEPIFAYKDGDGKFRDEKDGNIVEPPEGKAFKKIEVLSYISGIEKNYNGEYQLKTQKITGDHDQLSVGTKIRREDTLQDKNLSSDKGFADTVGHAITTALIDETKSSGAVRHGQDSGGTGTKGSLSKEELQELITNINSSKDLTEFLDKPETKKIAESKLGGNPYPEDFAPGNYATYTPNGNIMVAHNEAEVVDKYNILEAQGYNIGINPRYGWKRGDDDKLEIDPDKISAQSFIKAKVEIETVLNKTLPQDITPETRKEIITDIHKDSDRLYKMSSTLYLIKVQEDSPEKREAMSVATNMLRNAENKYASDHGIVPPTVSAMTNEERKIARKTEMEQIISSTPLKDRSEQYNINSRESPNSSVSYNDTGNKSERVLRATSFDSAPKADRGINIEKSMINGYNSIKPVGSNAAYANTGIDLSQSKKKNVGKAH